jgi:hypothetical protein
MIVILSAGRALGCVCLPMAATPLTACRSMRHSVSSQRSATKPFTVSAFQSDAIYTYSKF